LADVDVGKGEGECATAMLVEGWSESLWRPKHGASCIFPCGIDAGGGKRGLDS